MAMQQLDSLVNELNAQKSLRVWSLVITFFGDAILPRGGVVSAQTVQNVMARLGVEPGALRTAFSRLAAEKWVVRSKQGRRSFYHLSPAGLDIFKTASKQIYAPVSRPKTSPTWLLAISNNTEFSADNALISEYDGLRLNAGCVLFNRSEKRLRDLLDERDILRVDGNIDTIPSWVKNLACPPQIGQGYRNLIEQFSMVANVPSIDPLEAVATRCLLIHEWRRLLLRSKHVPVALQPRDWPQENCHIFVRDLYNQLLQPSEKWLDNYATGLDNKRALETGSMKNRFMLQKLIDA